MAKKQGYDAFVSYNHKNKRFVHEWLVPALKRRRLRVLLDEDVFTGGKYIIAEVENAVRASRAVVLVCTPEYFDSTWTELESKLAFGKVVAVIVKTCKLPDWLQARISLDFKTPAMREKSLPRLLEAIRETGDGGDDVANAGRGTIFNNPAARLLCRFVVDCYQYLGFRGMGVTDRVPLKLSLGDLYVPLRARVQPSAGETLDRIALRVGGRELSKEESHTTGHANQAQSVLDLVRDWKGVIVLGDPGFEIRLTVKRLPGYPGRIRASPPFPSRSPLPGSFSNACSATREARIRPLARTRQTVSSPRRCRRPLWH